MRRAFAISVAILFATLATHSALAQDANQQQSVEKLIQTIKANPKLAAKLYKALQPEMQGSATKRAQTDERLAAIDRIEAKYLAKNGDGSEGMGANVSYEKGKGFGFTSGDGNFALYVGGLFDFSYVGEDNSKGLKDTNSFSVEENRLLFQGHAFSPKLTYYIDFDAAGTEPLSSSVGSALDLNSGKAQITSTSSSLSLGSGVTLLDAYFEYALCQGVKIRGGQFKVPYGREFMVYQGDRELVAQNPESAAFSVGRDVGIMIHDVIDLKNMGMNGNSTMNSASVEYAFGAWNGNGMGSHANESSALAWAGRLGFYPLGYIPYVEGDWEHSPHPKVGVATTYYSNRAHYMGAPDTTARDWELDGVATWNGLYLTGEYFTRQMTREGGPFQKNDRGWYVQAGYMILAKRLEVIGSWGKGTFEEHNVIRYVGEGFPIYSRNAEYRDWLLGVAYYFDNHQCKVAGQVGQVNYHHDGPNNDQKYTAVRLVFQAEW